MERRYDKIPQHLQHSGTMDIRDYNRIAWDRLVQSGDRWTIPASREVIKAARRGEWEIFLTPTKSIPQDWFPRVKDLNVLCLASGGGQQGPILAAVGARVTVLDNSPKQLEQDHLVAGQRFSLYYYRTR